MSGNLQIFSLNFLSFELKINRLSMSLGSKKENIPFTKQEIEGIVKGVRKSLKQKPIDTGSGCMFFLIVSIVSSYLLF